MKFELEELVNIYGEKLLRYAASILYNSYDAEDIVQDVFISANLNQDKFDGKNLSAWLYKITYNKCMNKLKRRKVLFFNDVGDVAVPDFAESSNDGDIWRVLKILKPADRALLYGKIMEGYSYEELSEQMGGTADGLRKRYERAKRKIAQHLDFSYEAKGAIV